MDKKGFVKTIEAVITVIIIFGSILFILPKGPQLPQGKMPEALEATANALIEELENDDLFRKCVLLDNGGQINQKTNVQCIGDFLASALPPFSPWNFGFTICNVPIEIKDTLQQSNCIGYVGNKDIREFDEKKVFAQLAAFENELPSGNVYTRRILVSVDDVTAIPVKSPKLKEYKSVTLYFWQ